ncbi:Protein of unknown function, partial [Gryllus bimaculatus]
MVDNEVKLTARDTIAQLPCHSLLQKAQPICTATLLLLIGSQTMQGGLPAYSVNGGRTVADWERFLRSTENSILSRANSYQQRIAVARERFLRSQQEALDEVISEGNREGVNANDIRGAVHQLKGNKHAQHSSLDPMSYSEIESTTVYSSASAPVSAAGGADSLVATA